MDSIHKKQNLGYIPYSQSQHQHKLWIPPIRKNILRAQVIEYFLKNTNVNSVLPTDSFTIFRNIKRNYLNVDYAVYVFSKLNINDVIRDFISNNVIISYDIIYINFKQAFYIRKIDQDRLTQYKLELNNDGTVPPNYQRYSEIAKGIALNILREKKIELDKDDIFNTNTSISHYTQTKTGMDRNMEMLLEEYTMNNNGNTSKDEENNQNYLKEFVYAPTALQLLNTDLYTDAKDVMKQGGSGDYKSVLDKIKTKYGSSLRPFCEFGTRAECAKKKKDCEFVHFKQIIGPHTDVSSGACSYLDTCRHMEICRYVHYQIEDGDLIPSNRKELVLSGDQETLDSQWTSCDIRHFDYDIIGKFDVIMADPPWDIHMDLPYGTLSDDEMKNLKVKNLQDDGVIFLWVTGRATELARECWEWWGYERKEEWVWIKTNQLQRLIRTGRTGHWLNHSKEHCLIGYKGNPKLNRNVDCDVLVSEVRETSRKPDEIYELIERMMPGGRKLELFARPHNRRKGWISLGNQWPGAYFVEKDIIERYNARYPDNILTKEIMDENKEISTLKKEEISLVKLKEGEKENAIN